MDENKKEQIMQTIDNLTRLANSFSSDNLELLVGHLVDTTHRTLQQSLMRGFVLPLLKRWSEDFKNGHYDLRNEATVKLANKIVESIKDNEYLPFV